LWRKEIDKAVSLFSLYKSKFSWYGLSDRKYRKGREGGRRLVFPLWIDETTPVPRLPPMKSHDRKLACIKREGIKGTLPD